MKNILKKEFWAERDMEVFIGKLLRYGVIASCVITIFGGIIYIYQHQTLPDYSPIPDDQPFLGVDHYLRELTSIIPHMLAFDGAAIVQFGVCVLIATPIMRIVVSIFAFIIEKDYLYITITVIVLCIILANMIFGLH